MQVKQGVFPVGYLRSVNLRGAIAGRVGVIARDARPKRVLVAHNVTRGNHGGMALMMESMHTALEPLAGKRNTLPLTI